MTFQDRRKLARRSPWTWLYALTSVALLVVVNGGPAYASSGHVDGAVTGITPAFKGVQVLGTAGGELTIFNTSAQPLIVYGYFDEPYVKIDASGVWLNKNSPSNALNSSFTIGTLPNEPNAATHAPNWVKQNVPFLSDGGYQWHDHRAHYMGVGLPPVAAKDPDHVHVIERWTIPITYGSRKGTINGTLTYYPNSRLTTYLLRGLIALAVVGFAVLIVLDRRRLKAKAAAPTETGPPQGTPST